ncbi:hypothetical protein GCM10025857_68160 [Alicyclobacillus contaminans]|nr:hypothetical protein GCM10025857_33740 [Alicyclobacillus contaminans]GMA55435.1 hypothetical protein GCM10025857_67920 [Alicyclobacillus contaminans]GMA55459.1 hypothetical protein GCM10025857_68160 [Alicyclobacillus contaminans]
MKQSTIDYLKQVGLWPPVVPEGSVGNCNNCKREIKGPANFCGRCGTKLEAPKPN